MTYFTQYMEDPNPILLDKFIEERNKGFLYIDGGLISLATVRLRLDVPRNKSIPNALKVGKWYFYQLEFLLLNDKTVPIENNPILKK